MHKIRKRISGWGNYPKLKAIVIAPSTVNELQKIVVENSSILARGGGNSYGDSSLQNVVINTRCFNKIISEGPDWIEVQAGITIKELFEYTIPQKKFLPVTPGTQSVTIGGAIASDVHGKNHLHEGSFFNATTSLQLVNENGELINCSREENTSLFYRCFGGMGLCGIIVSAVIKLNQLPSFWIWEQHFFASDFKELLLLMEANRTAPYLVAWIDILNAGTKGIVKTGRWLKETELPYQLPPYKNDPHKTIRIPFRFPFAPPAFSFKWYNRRYLAKAQKHQTQLLHYTAFFYPLDGIKNWKFVFGPKGLLQYHFMMPLHSAEEGMNKIITVVKNSKAVCTLAVIKLFRKENAETPYSFPREGYNMALDFLHTSSAVAVIKQLDRIVQSFSGTVYKTKDAFSGLPEAIESTRFQSIQNKRYGSG